MHSCSELLWTGGPHHPHREPSLTKCLKEEPMYNHQGLLKWLW